MLCSHIRYYHHHLLPLLLILLILILILLTLCFCLRFYGFLSVTFFFPSPLWHFCLGWQASPSLECFETELCLALPFFPIINLSDMFWSKPMLPFFVLLFAGCAKDNITRPSENEFRATFLKTTFYYRQPKTEAHERRENHVNNNKKKKHTMETFPGGNFDRARGFSWASCVSSIDHYSAHLRKGREKRR